jgi:hypothetical protein
MANVQSLGDALIEASEFLRGQRFVTEAQIDNQKLSDIARHLGLALNEISRRKGAPSGN